jgi:hypothetical protein
MSEANAELAGHGPDIVDMFGGDEKPDAATGARRSPTYRKIRQWGRTIVIALPGIIPLAVYAVSEWLLIKATLFDFNIGLRFDVAHDYKHFFDGSIAGKEAGARYFVATSLLVFLITGAAAFVVVIWLMRQNFVRLSRSASYNKSGFAKAVGCIAVLFIVTVIVAWVDKARLYEYVGRGVFPQLLDLYFRGRPQLGFDPSHVMSDLLTWTSTLAIITGVAIAVCGGTFLAGISVNSVGGKPTYDEVKAYFADRVARLKILLVAASACFVAGILHFKAWQAWPLSLMRSDSIVEKQYSALIDGLANYQGTRFALVLLSILFCAQLGLRVGAKHLLAGYTETPAKLFTDSGLSFDIPETMKSTLTILAPLLVGPLVEIFKAVSAS